MTKEMTTKAQNIQQEFEEFIKNRFGKGVQIFTSQMGSDFSSEKNSEDLSKGSDNEKAFQLNFDYTPREVKNYLDRFVVKQDEAKIALSIAICDHYNHARLSQSKGAQSEPRNKTYDYSKQNVLLLGPTGVGKTYLIRKAAELIGVPFVKADATRFSETGYMGANVDDLIRDLVQQAEGDLSKAEFGIVYLDEADKIASPKQQSGKDVNGRGVQFGLLRLMEESEVDLRSGNDMQSQMQALFDLQKGEKATKKINTKHILFIVSGAFSGLEKIIEKRVSQRSIGFQHVQKETDQIPSSLFSEATTQDFIDFGFEPEFIGRLPVRVACDPLDRDDLLHILQNSEGSIIRQYERSFEAYDIALTFTDAALTLIAEQAVKEQTGARSLLTVCERLMRPFKFHLPSTNIERLVVNEACVQQPVEYLQSILTHAENRKPSRSAQILKENKNQQSDTSSAIECDEDEMAFASFESYFFETYDIAIKLKKPLRERIVATCRERSESVFDFCKNHFQGFEYGLLLTQQITQTSGQTIAIDETAFEDPQGYLEGLVRECFKKG